MSKFLIASMLLILCGCAEKKTRLWIDPPPGTDIGERDSQKLYYQVEDITAGRKESMSIPLSQMPDNLVVEQKSKIRAEDGLSLATRADHQISDGKTPAATASKPTVSYLRGLSEVESLYQKQQFGEALVRLAPLIEQYPKQTRLFVMQGTLYRKIGERKLSLAAYQRARDLDKDNTALEEAVLRAQDENGGTL